VIECVYEPPVATGMTLVRLDWTLVVMMIMGAPDVALGIDEELSSTVLLTILVADNVKLPSASAAEVGVLLLTPVTEVSLVLVGDDNVEPLLVVEVLLSDQEKAVPLVTVTMPVSLRGLAIVLREELVRLPNEEKPLRPVFLRELVVPSMEDVVQRELLGAPRGTSTTEILCLIVDTIKLSERV